VAAVLREPALRAPAHLRVDRALAEQKVTLALPADTARAALLQNLADLLQARWAKGKDDGLLTLRRRPEAAEALRTRGAAREGLRRRAVAEQRELLAAAHRRVVKALAGPEEEIFPGHFGRRGVPPGSEALAPLQARLTPADWHRVTEAASFAPGVPVGAGFTEPFDPAVLWPLEALSEPERRAVRGFLGGRGAVDEATVVVGLSNRAGVDLILGIFSGEWHQEKLVIAVKGSALRRLRAADEAPVFLSDGPTFTEGLPAPLAGRAREPVAWKAAEMDYAEACAALAKTLRAPVVADYYTLETRLRPGGTVPLGEAFTTLRRAFGCRFAWRRGMLLVRQGDWPTLDAREIPESLLQACLARKRPWLTLDTATLLDLAARLRPEQVDCLSAFGPRGRPDLDFAREAEVLRAEQPLLALLGAQSPAVRAGAFAGGVPFATLRQAAPEFERFARRQAPWLLTARAPVEGTLRLTRAAGPTLAVSSPNGRPTARLVLTYGRQGRTRTYSQETLIPWPDR